MKVFWNSAVVVLLVLVTATIVRQSPAAPPAAARGWEYARVFTSEMEGKRIGVFSVNAGQVIIPERSNIADAWNLMGAEGWELVATFQDGTGNVKSMNYIFKRPK